MRAPNRRRWSDRIPAGLLAVSLAILLTALPATFQAASAQTLPRTLERALQQYQIPAAAVSMEVRELETGKRLLGLNTREPRNPASVIKLLTTLSSLELLGPAYRWENTWLADGPITDGVLRGNLVFRGGGDPFFTVEHLMVHILALRQAGIDVIEGDFIIDNSLFSLPVHDRAAFDGKPSRLYNVGPDAALINFSATRFLLQPLDGKIRVLADPPLHDLTVINSISPKQGKCSNRNVGWHHELSRDGSKIRAHFRGTYPERCGKHSISRSLFPNPEYGYRLFRKLWSQMGGEMRGGFRLAAAPAEAREVLSRQSESLADIITGINKFSNNVMARMLLLTIGLEMKGQPATVESGILGIRNWLSANGMAMPELVLENGSGLSRKARISASSLSELLRHGWHSNYQPEFVSSLSLAAMDGTMQKRLNGSALYGRARIKTGLVNGVRSMAGYVNARNGRHYSVVMMIDTRKVNFWNGNAVQDVLLEWVYHLQ